VESGEAPRQLLAPPSGTWYRDAAIAPNGRSLALASCTGAADGPRCSLHIADLREGPALSGKPRQISKQSWYINGLAWKPNGASLIFSGRLLDATAYLWRVDLRDRKEPERLELAGPEAWRPTVDLTGHRLAFSRMSTNSDIWRMERSGKSAPFLTSSSSEYSPQYSPDGRRIAFASGRNAQMAVWIANADGAQPIQVSNLRSP
jgi:Tol biopolymer transport system component